MSSFREDTAANKKLQQESKDPNRTTVSYKRVTSKNKSQLSDQHLKKDKKSKDKDKKKRSGTKTPAGYVRVKGGRMVSTRTAKGKHAMNKLKAKQRAQAAAKKRLGK